MEPLFRENSHHHEAIEKEIPRERSYSEQDLLSSPLPLFEEEDEEAEEDEEEDEANDDSK